MKDSTPAEPERGPGPSQTSLNGIASGREVGEVGQVAAIAGYFGIPVIRLAGDQAACDELLALQPKAKTVAVKRLAGKASTLSLSHEEAKRQIRGAVEAAITHIKEYQPWKMAGPIEMTIEYLPSPPQQPAARISVFRGQTVLEACRPGLASRERSTATAHLADGSG